MKFSTTAFAFEVALATLIGSPAGALRASQHTYVIVHGAWGGGWDWKEVDHLLAADGNTVYRPTLTGLGEKSHLANPEINLTTHINDIVNVILYEDLHGIVLVGHSYAGMVITGVMDRVPERIQHAIFLDAAVPDDGESLNDFRRLVGLPEERVVDGFLIPLWLDANKPLPGEVPQSVKTWTDPVSFKNPAARKLRGTVVWFIPAGESQELGAFEPIGQRVAARGWKTLVFESDHLAERTHPRELAALLVSIVRNETPVATPAAN